MFDDDGMTPEEIEQYCRKICARIKAIEQKAIKRLLMSEREKAWRRLWKKLLQAPQLREGTMMMLVFADFGKKEQN